MNIGLGWKGSFQMLQFFDSGWNIPNRARMPCQRVSHHSQSRKRRSKQMREYLQAPSSPCDRDRGLAVLPYSSFSAYAVLLLLVASESIPHIPSICAMPRCVVSSSVLVVPMVEQQAMGKDLGSAESPRERKECVQCFICFPQL